MEFVRTELFAGSGDMAENIISIIWVWFALRLSLLLFQPLLLGWYYISYCDYLGAWCTLLSHIVILYLCSESTLASKFNRQAAFMFPPSTSPRTTSGGKSDERTRGKGAPTGAVCLKHHPSSHPTHLHSIRFFPHQHATLIGSHFPPRRRPGGPRSTARL